MVSLYLRLLFNTCFNFKKNIISFLFFNLADYRVIVLFFLKSWAPGPKPKGVVSNYVPC